MSEKQSDKQDAIAREQSSDVAHIPLVSSVGKVNETLELTGSAIVYRLRKEVSRGESG